MKNSAIPVPEDIKGLIFDLDGTLIDSMSLHHEAYNHALAPFSVHYPKETFYSRGGIPPRDTMQLIQEEFEIENFNLDEVLKAKMDYVGSNYDKIQLIQPTFDIVKAYHGKLPMAIGTGNMREVVNEVFSRLPLTEYIKHVVTASDVVHHKPHPETFLRCAELINVQPENCVVFEDGKPGIQAAKAAGMEVIDVTLYL